MQRRGARSRAAARPCAASTQPGYSDQPVQVRLLILREVRRGVVIMDLVIVILMDGSIVSLCSGWAGPGSPHQ